MDRENLIYLTEKEIDEIEKLDILTIRDYIKGLPEDKKRLVIKQHEKEMAMRQWQYIANEKY